MLVGPPLQDCNIYHHSQVLKRVVDSYEEGMVIPKCSLTATAVNKDKDSPPIQHQVQLIGSKSQNIVTISVQRPMFFTGELAHHMSIVIVYNTSREAHFTHPRSSEFLSFAILHAYYSLRVINRDTKGQMLHNMKSSQCSAITYTDYDTELLLVD